MDPRLRILMLGILIVLLAVIALTVIALLMIAWRRSIRRQRKVEAKHRIRRGQRGKESLDAWSEAGRRLHEPADDDEEQWE